MIYTRDINNLFMSPIYTKCKKYYHASLLIKKEFVFIISFEKVNISLWCAFVICWVYSSDNDQMKWEGFCNELICSKFYMFQTKSFFFSTWNKINTYIEIFGISYIWILTVKKKTLFFCRKFNSNVSRICIPTIHFKIKIYIIMKWNITVIEY